MSLFLIKDKAKTTIAAKKSRNKYVSKALKYFKKKAPLNCDADIAYITTIADSKLSPSS